MNAARHWDHYWGLGFQDSCFSGGKPLDTAPVWAPFFQSLAPGAQVLDLACGAGAVPRQALAVRADLDITGADFASEIKPIEGVSFLTGVSIEQLPLADGAFDAVTSQFGFEYAQRDAATREAARVLAPGGRLRLLVHAREGDAVRDLAGRLSRGRATLAPNGFADLLKRWAEAAVAGGAQQVSDEDINAAIDAAGRMEHDNTTRRVLSVLKDAYTMRRMFGPAYVLEKTNALTEELALYCARVDDMQRAALTESDARAASGGFLQLGLEMEPIFPMNDAAGALMGWILGGRRLAS